jgi:hypothetical protein
MTTPRPAAGPDRGGPWSVFNNLADNQLRARAASVSNARRSAGGQGAEAIKNIDTRLKRLDLSGQGGRQSGGAQFETRRLWWVAVLSIGATAGPSGGNQPNVVPETITTTDPALQRSYADFKRSLELSPLVRLLGRPVSCAVSVDDGSIRLGYVSSEGAKLEAQHDPAIEFTEQRLTASGLSRKTAVAVLQRTERWAFGDKGCSIAWKTAGLTLIRERNAVRYATAGAHRVHGKRSDGLVFRSALKVKHEATVT